MKLLTLQLIMSLEKIRQRVDSSFVNKGKGPAIDDLDETGDNINPEDAEYILKEEDLVIIDEIWA